MRMTVADKLSLENQKLIMTAISVMMAGEHTLMRVELTKQISKTQRAIIEGKVWPDG